MACRATKAKAAFDTMPKHERAPPVPLPDAEAIAAANAADAEFQVRASGAAGALSVLFLAVAAVDVFAAAAVVKSSPHAAPQEA